MYVILRYLLKALYTVLCRDFVDIPVPFSHVQLLCST